MNIKKIRHPRRTIANAKQRAKLVMVTEGIPEQPTRLWALRAQRGWTREDMQRHSGVGAAHLRAMERGTFAPYRRGIYQVAMALGLLPEQVVAASQQHL